MKRRAEGVSRGEGHRVDEKFRITPRPRCSYRSDAVLGSACFIGPSLLHRSKDSARTSMLLQGNTSPTLTSTALINTTTPPHHRATSPYCDLTPPPRLFSGARWTVSRRQARTERGEADGAEDSQNKSSSVCTRDVAPQTQSFLSSSPFSVFSCPVPVDLPCVFV